MLSIGALSLRILIRSLTLIGLDFPLTTLIGLDFPLTTLISITEKRKQFLTCTQKTARAKLEQLHSVRLIQGDQKMTTRYAKALNKTNAC
jgi:hypothetical protein